MAAIEAAEVRTAAMRSMKPDERLKVIRDAVENGDATFVSAVVSGSYLLSGLGQAEQAVARDMWQRKHHGDIMERIRRLRGAQAQLDRLSNLFTAWAGSLYAEKNAAIAAAERSAQLAAEAMKES